MNTSTLGWPAPPENCSRLSELLEGEGELPVRTNKTNVTSRSRMKSVWTAGQSFPEEFPLLV